MKLSQMQKVYCRYRFININYGTYLREYFEWSASRFDPESSKTPQEILSHNKKYYASMVKYRVAFDPFETAMVRTVMYSVS